MAIDNPLSAFYRGFQGAQQATRAREQQDIQNQLAEQLRGIQLMNAQQQAAQFPMQQALLAEQLRKARMTPEELAIEAARASNIQNLASQQGVIFTGAPPIEEITPQAQELLKLRQGADQAGGLPFSREGIAGIQMQTAIPGLPGAVISPAQITRQQDQARMNAAFKRELEGPKLQEVNGTLLRVPTTGAPEVLFNAPKATQSKFEFVKNVNDPKDVRYLPINPETGAPPEGYSFLKTGEGGMKPSEVISSQREIRTVYDELPAKIDFFGKGQIPGSNQLKTRLDAVLTPLKGDFSKLNPQAKQTFVFAINKLRDPSSATLLSEASQIAARAGIGDRFNSFIENYKSGDPLPDQVAKDIYEVISQVHAAHKENLINSLVPLSEDIGGLGKKLTAIGVPKDIQDEVEKRISSATPNATGVLSREEAQGILNEVGGDKEKARALAKQRGFSF